MFDISFSELLVIAIVALVVIGPEKLPKVARTAGAFFGRLQRFVAQVKDEVNRESRFAELQKLQEEVQSSLQQGYADIEQTISSASQQHEELSEVAAAKKPRKPRLAKSMENDATVAKPRRRTKAADASAKVVDSPAITDTEGSSGVSTVGASPRRQRKPKTGSATTDMFVDEPLDLK